MDLKFLRVLGRNHEVRENFYFQIKHTRRVGKLVFLFDNF